MIDTQSVLNEIAKLQSRIDKIVEANADITADENTENTLFELRKQRAMLEASLLPDVEDEEDDEDQDDEPQCEPCDEDEDE
jgi:hypothetical protein